MKSPRFFAPEAAPGRLVLLSPDEAHHLRDVLRIGEGEEVVLLNGRGEAYRARVEGISRREVLVRVEGLEERESEPRFFLEILIPLLKGGRTEFLVEKATELGAGRILPFVSRYTVRTPSPRTHERLKARAIQALKQCGRLRLPEVEPPEELPRVLQKVRAERRCVAYEKGGLPLRKAFSSLPRDLALASGPEGGFSEEEIGLFQEAGFLPVSLGPYILRAETATLFLLSVWRYHSLT